MGHFDPFSPPRLNGRYAEADLLLATVASRMLAGILHIVEAFILAESKAADTSIPIASLLDAFGGHRITLVATMLVSALLALTVAGQRPGVLAIFALIP